jgi:uncharacterized C2H2 Zn-finger protein
MIKIMAQESKCPYCESLFDDNEQLSKHIDKIHNNSEAIGTQGL